MSARHRLAYLFHATPPSEVRLWGLCLAACLLLVVSLVSSVVAIEIKSATSLVKPDAKEEPTHIAAPVKKVAKDLFSDRITLTASAKLATPAPPTRAQWVNLSGFKLNGTLTVSGKQKALISGNDGKSYYATVGSRVSDYTIIRIEKSRVLLLDSNEAAKGEDAVSDPQVTKYVIQASP